MKNQSFSLSMDVKSKQQWSVEETHCLLALWASTEVQSKLEGASRTKPVFEQIQREMATAGYDRNVEQINNKLKKLRKEYRDQKKGLGRSGNGRPGRNPHFDLLDSVLGDRPPACPLSGDLNSAMLGAMVDDRLSPSHPDLSAVRTRTRTCTTVPPVTLPLSPRLSPSTYTNTMAEETRCTTCVRGKRKRGSSDYMDFMKEMLLMAEDREDRRQQVQQEFEERRLRVVQDLENSAGLRETELIQTLIEFNQGLLDVLRKLVMAVESKQNCAPPH